MASVRFYTRGKRNPSKIGLRFMVNGHNDFRRTTPIQINPSYFNNATGKVKHLAKFKDASNVQNELNRLENAILSDYNKAVTNGIVINAEWLQNAINVHLGLEKVKDLSFLLNYCNHYVDTLRIKTNDKTGLLGSSKATITKYTTIARKIEAMQAHNRKRYRLTDVDMRFRDAFLKYLLDTEKLSRNTVGRYIKFLKTIVLHAKRSGYKVSTDLEQMKGFKVEVKKIYLSFDELERIEATDYKDEKLLIASHWLLLGCHIGQRASDLLHLDKTNITVKNGRNFIELTQQKTKKRVAIPITEPVQAILDNYGGGFPPKYSNNIQSANAIFNRHLKRVAYKAKLNDTITDIGKVNPKTGRKEIGDFKKWELVTSHICRRSFATNFYGEMPTPLIMQITAHSTEAEFYNYIGKTPLDYAEQMAQYWDLIAQKQKKETVLKAVN